MADQIDGARRAIGTYAHSMDAGRFDRAAGVLTTTPTIDYAEVGGPKAAMRRDEVEQFLTALLRKPNLSVHTAIHQVLESEDQPNAFIAYYTVRHFHREGDQQTHFSIVGWYEFQMEEDLISSLSIRTQAMEGDPGILA